MVSLGAFAAELPTSITVIDYGKVARRAFPTSGGIPFPRGALYERDLKKLALFTSGGQGVPVQYRVNGFWLDRSIKWLQMDFLSSNKAGGRATYTLALRDKKRITLPLLAQKTEAGVEVNTGVLKAIFGLKGCRIRVRQHGKWRTVADGPFRSQVILMARGAAKPIRYNLPIADVEIEENGFNRVTLKVKGWHRTASRKPLNRDASPNFSKSDLEFWLQSDKGVQYIDNDKAIFWADQSGHARHAVNRTVGVRPLCYLHGLNDMPTILNRKSSYMRLAKAMSLKGDFTLVVLCAPRKDRKVSESGPLMGDGEGAYISIDPFQKNSVSVRLHRDAPSVTIRWEAPFGQGDFCILTFVRKGEELKVFRNGVAGTIAGGAVSTRSLTIRTLLSAKDEGPNFVGDMAEILAFSRALPSRERKGVEEYLNGKWALVPDESRFSPSVVRLIFNRGQRFFKMQHTWVMSADPQRHTIARIGVDMQLASEVNDLVFAQKDGGSGVLALDKEQVTILQEDTAITVYPPQDEFQPRFRIIAGHDKMVHEGKRYPGAMVLKGRDIRVGVYLHDMWKMHPKALAYAPASRTLSVEFWPTKARALDLRRTEEKNLQHYRDFAAKDRLFKHKKYSPAKYVTYDLRNSAMGMARTHEVVYDFGIGEGMKTPGKLAAEFKMPFVPFASPEWNVRSGVMGKQIFPGAFREDIERICGLMMNKLITEVEKRGWYGAFRYGNVRYAFNKTNRCWMHYNPKYAWYNSGHVMEGGTMLQALWYQYLRTGDPRYYVLADARAKSKMDVSTVHYHRQLPVGAMVRHGGYDPWVGSRSGFGAHAPLNGLPVHYYVTGYKRGLDVCHRIGRSNYEYNFFNHGRTIDTDINTMKLYYELTLDKKYYDHAISKVQYYYDTLDVAKNKRTFFDYRTHNLRTLWDLCGEGRIRRKIEKIFLESLASIGSGNREACAWAYEIERTAARANRLEKAMEGLARGLSGEIDWGTHMLHNMNDFGQMSGICYELYWLQKANDGKVMIPVMRPDGGTFHRSIRISLATWTLDATIRYTLDGSEPTASSELYRGPITLTKSATVKAKGFKPGWKPKGTIRRTFTITDLPFSRQDLALWLRADAGVKRNSPGVSLWADQSGRGRHAVQSDRKRQPTLVANRLKGLPAIRGGEGKCMILSRLAPLTGNCSLFFVNTFSERGGCLLGDSDDGAVSGKATRKPRFGIRFSVGERGLAGRLVGRMEAGRFALWEVTRRGSAVRFYRNGKIATRKEQFHSKGTTMNVSVLMGTRSYRPNFYGEMAEILLFDRAMPVQERKQVERYLMDKYGLQ